MLILGDIAHSRVARSNVLLLTKLGAKVRLCGPRTLMPPALSTWPVEVTSDLYEAADGVDAVIVPEAATGTAGRPGSFPDIREYAARWCLGPKHLERAARDVRLMHPGPMNRGVEINSALADASESLVLDQVANGVSTRMALLFLHLMRRGSE